MVKRKVASYIIDERYNVMQIVFCSLFHALFLMAFVQQARIEKLRCSCGTYACVLVVVLDRLIKLNIELSYACVLVVVLDHHLLT